VLNTVAVQERKLPNVITAVNFDYRGLDTLGEENILFAAVAGLALVLRRDRERTTKRPLPAAPGRARTRRSDAVRAFSILGIALTVAYGTYMAIHPHLTPGGGFQGGTILSGFAALTFLGLGYEAFSRVIDEEPFELLEALGAGAYTLIGLSALAIAGFFLANVLPLGGEGMLFSSGTIALINFFVALEVCTGFVLVFLEFTRETRQEEPERGEG
jgi:multicomponent Na+:H+ antiporter subunit B